MDALTLLLLPVFGFIGVLGVKWLDQTQRDKNRRAYRLGFPADLDPDRVQAWIRSISGTMRAGPGRFVGVPTVAFEVWATHEGITHRIKVPWSHADYVVTQLRSLVPGVRVTPEDERPQRIWTSSVEVGLTNSDRQLRIYNASDMAHSILASLQALEEGETVIIQWVVSPAIPERLPIFKEARTTETSLHGLTRGGQASRDEVQDRREKLSEPNMLAVLRVGAVANTQPRSDHLVYRVKSSLASARGPSTRFVKRFVSKAQRQKRITHASGSVTFPIQLSVPELAALIAWPIGNPNIQGLPPVHSRHMPASEAVPREGRVLGRSNFPGAERVIAQPYSEALKHTWIIGASGSGKTTLLANMIRQDMQNGYGVVLIENKGDLFHLALDYVPQERINDVIVVDVNDSKMPVGFNVLTQGGKPQVNIDELTQLFEMLYPDTRGVWTREVLYHGLRTLITQPALTFVDLAPLLMPMNEGEAAWRENVLSGITDDELRAFWDRYRKQPVAQQQKIIQPVMDRIWQFNARPEVRNIIGQSESSFEMADVVRDNKILLVNLAGLPRDTASLSGTLLTNALWQSVKSTRSERPTFLYLDEFQTFLNLPVDPEDMLAKARSFGLGMTLAHQHLDQLTRPMKQAVLGNVSTKVVLQASSDDANAMVREFGSAVTHDDFMHIGRYEAIARVATPSGVSPPLTVSTNEPARGNDRAAQVAQQSRQTYGRPITQVESAIHARRNDEGKASRRRPRISGVWGQEDQ